MLPGGGSQAECSGRSVSACRVRRDYGNVEVHQFISAGVAYTGQIDMRPLGRVAHILDVEKQEAILGGVRLDRKGAELSTIDFLELLLGLLVLVAEGNRNATGMSRIGAAGVDV